MDGASAPATPSHSRERDQDPEREGLSPGSYSRDRLEEVGAGLGSANRGDPGGGARSFSTETEEY